MQCRTVLSSQHGMKCFEVVLKIQDPDTQFLCSSSEALSGSEPSRVDPRGTPRPTGPSQCSIPHEPDGLSVLKALLYPRFVCSVGAGWACRTPLPYSHETKREDLGRPQTIQKAIRSDSKRPKRSRRDSNPQSSPPEGDALSITLRDLFSSKIRQTLSLLVGLRWPLPPPCRHPQVQQPKWQPKATPALPNSPAVFNPHFPSPGHP